jgi:hypothetical protein
LFFKIDALAGRATKTADAVPVFQHRFSGGQAKVAFFGLKTAYFR